MSNVDVRITRARSQLVINHPFFGALAMRLKVVERPDIRTMATDGEYLFYSQKFLAENKDPEVEAIVAHEVMHCALGHHTRRNGRDHELWNEACDYVVNDLVRQAGLKLPNWALFDPQYAGLNAEQVYKLLSAAPKPEKPDEQAQPQSGEGQEEGETGPGQTTPDKEGPEQEGEGEPGAGGDKPREEQGNGTGEGEASGSGAEGSDDSSESGEGEANGDGEGSGSGSTSGQAGAEGAEPGKPWPKSHGDPGRCGEIMDAAPEHDEAALAEAADEWQVFTRQAANVARRQGEGKLPGFAQEVIDTLNEPQVDWRDVLRRFIDPSSTKDYSWSQPNRRYTPFGFYSPGMISDGISHIALLIDTSGSIDEELLRRFGAETQAALDNGAIDKVTVVMADTRVTGHAEYTKGDTIDFTVNGRGGTAFAPTFEWVNENAPDVTAAVYFTDLDCTEYGKEPPYPVLWAAYDPDPRMLARRAERVPFGEVVTLQ